MHGHEGGQEGEGPLRYRVDIGPGAVRTSIERQPLDLKAKPGEGTWPIKNHQEGIKKVKEWMAWFLPRAEQLKEDNGDLRENLETLMNELFERAAGSNANK